MEQLIKASLDEGVEEARLLLRDWLTILLTYYNEQLEDIERAKAKRSGKPPPPKVDISPILLSFST